MKHMSLGVTAAATMVFAATLTGCSTKRMDCCDAESARILSTPREGSIPVVSLERGLEPLRRDFAAAAGKPRLMLLLSPVCGGCVRAAEALSEIQKAGGVPKDLPIFVVWLPMVEGDSEAAAAESAKLLPKPQVHHFYDPERTLGRKMPEICFPRFRERALASLPADHWFRPHLEEAVQNPTLHSTTMWDAALLYGPDAEWREEPPCPTLWTKQTAYFAEGDAPPMGLFWRDNCDAPPHESEWRKELERLLSDGR